MKKSNQLEAYRLSKKCPGLDRVEKRALNAIADACSMRDRVCRKSVETISEEHGLSARSFRYGVRGRRRKDGSYYFPGLLRREIVSIKSGGTRESGVPTTYEINLEVLRHLAEDVVPEPIATSAQTIAQTSAHTTAQPLHNSDGTTAQISQNLCTGAVDLCTGAAKVPNEVPKVPNTGTQEREACTLTQKCAAPVDSPAARSGSADTTAKTNGQKNSVSDASLESVMTWAKRLDSRVQFSKTSREELRKAIADVRDRVTVEDMEYAVRKSIERCHDEKAFSFFGSTLAVNFGSDALAHKAQREAAERKKHEEKPWCQREEAFIKSEECKALTDVQKWLTENPEDDGNIATLGHWHVRQTITHFDDEDPHFRIRLEYEHWEKANRESSGCPYSTTDNLRHLFKRWKKAHPDEAICLPEDTQVVMSSRVVEITKS